MVLAISYVVLFCFIAYQKIENAYQKKWSLWQTCCLLPTGHEEKQQKDEHLDVLRQ